MRLVCTDPARLRGERGEESHEAVSTTDLRDGVLGLVAASRDTLSVVTQV